MRKALVTGGVGFIGSALALDLLDAGWKVALLDVLTYAAAPGTAETLKAAGARVIKQDIRNGPVVRDILSDLAPDVVFHLAAETHVDRSIEGSRDFVTTNINGTFELLEAIRTLKTRQPVLVHVSTDEVFGTLARDDAAFEETTPYDPSSPYSASKAGSDHLVKAWGRTYGLDVRVSNCSNNYGPRQFPEKLIPLMTLKAAQGAALPVYGDGSNIRDWLHVGDHATALRMIAERGQRGETYCIGGNAERSNLAVVELICDHLDTVRPGSEPRRTLINFVTDRPGHDWRYAINANKAERELGWSPTRSFEDGLRETVDWYLENTAWWEPLWFRYSGERLGTTG